MQTRRPYMLAAHLHAMEAQAGIGIITLDSEIGRVVGLRCDLLPSRLKPGNSPGSCRPKGGCRPNGPARSALRVMHASKISTFKRSFWNPRRGEADQAETPEGIRTRAGAADAGRRFDAGALGTWRPTAAPRRSEPGRVQCPGMVYVRIFASSLSRPARV